MGDGSFTRAEYNMLDRLTENIGRLADEVERLNDNLEED